MKSIILVCVFLFFAVFMADAGTNAHEKAAIKQVLIESYVNGIHINRDTEAVMDGFHPDFRMHVYDDGKIIQVDLQMWLDHLKLDGRKNPKSIWHEFNLIDVTGNSAVVKMAIYEDEQHIYTDYFGLYRFENGWKIVNKIFYDHD